MKKKTLFLSILMVSILSVLALASCTIKFEEPEVYHGPHDHIRGEYIEAVAPTCVATGLTRGLKCADCGEIVTPQKEVPATGKHTYGIDHKCTVCGFEPELTEGLKYESYSNGTAYEVVGIGTATGSVLYIPDTYNGKPVASIAEFAFQNNKKLEYVIIPDTVANIGVRAFFGCSNIKDLTVSKNVQDIAEDAFLGCTPANAVVPANAIMSVVGSSDKNQKLVSVVITGGTEIPTDAFKDCKTLKSVVIANTVTKIGAAAFNGCSALDTLVMPTSLKSIDNYAFNSCGSITNLVIPTGVERIGSDAFAYCSSIKSIVVPEGVKYLGVDAFAGCRSAESIKLPNSLEYIGEGAFRSCNKAVSIERGVTYADKWVVDCDASAVEAKLRVDTIGISASAFSGCDKLTSVTVPASVKHIGENQFVNSPKLAEIKYVGSIEGWNKININEKWDATANAYTIKCSNGDITK